MERAWACFVLPIVVASCAATEDGRDDVALGSTRQAIIGGVASTAARDATVRVNDAGQQEGCTGTLIAPNLVLTARHCVTDFNFRNECGEPLGSNAPASVFSISVGVYANPQQAVARATRLFVPNASGLCNADIALLLLDKDIPNAKVASVRFTPPSAQEQAIAVGYGEGGDGRRERSVNILAIGPQQTTYTTRGGFKIPLNLPGQDFATGESTCFGDSGGPLIDGSGQVIGVASRGVDDRCDDRPTIWTSLAAHRDLIVDAAKAAGHPLASATSSGSTNNAVENGNQARTADEDGSEDDDANASNGKSKDTSHISSAGCATSANASPRTAASWAGMVAALGLALLRRRARTR